MIPAVRLILAAVCLTLLAAPAADARTCRAPAGIAKLNASRTSCATASAIARRSLATRRDTRRYAAARRCRGSFCIVVSGWRCAPLRSPQPKERCVRRRASITWVTR